MTSRGGREHIEGQLLAILLHCPPLRNKVSFGPKAEGSPHLHDIVAVPLKDLHTGPPLVPVPQLDQHVVTAGQHVGQHWVHRNAPAGMAAAGVHGLNNDTAAAVLDGTLRRTAVVQYCVLVLVYAVCTLGAVMTAAAAS